MSNVFKLKKDLVDMVPWDEFDEVIVLGKRKKSSAVLIYATEARLVDSVWMLKCFESYINQNLEIAFGEARD